MLCLKIIGLSLPAGIFLEWVGNIFFFYIFMMLINKSIWILSNNPIIIGKKIRKVYMCKRSN